MAAEQSSFGSAVKTTANLIGAVLGIVTIIAVIILVLPSVKGKSIQDIFTLATADTRGLKATPFPTTSSFKPNQDDSAQQQRSIQQAIDKYNADQQATAQAIPAPNVDQLPADAPAVEYGSRTNDRAPAIQDNVSVAQDDTHGSKPVDGPVNIQETHQCLHGQVWTPSGCHKPTPVK